MEIGRLPVVDDDGAVHGGEARGDQVRTVGVVKDAGQVSEPLAGVGDDRLRGLERVTRAELPREAEVVNAPGDTHATVLCRLGEQTVGRGIDEVDAIDVAVRFIGAGSHHGEERVLGRGGGDALGIYGKDAVPERGALGGAFRRPGTGERQRLVGAGGKIERKTERALERQGMSADIFESHGARQRRRIGKQGVEQDGTQTFFRVLERDLQRLSAKGGGEPCEARLGDHAVAFVGQPEEGITVLVAHAEHRLAEVAATVGREFGGNVVLACFARQLCVTTRPGDPARIAQVVARDARAEPKMLGEPVFHGEGVGDLVVFKIEGSGSLFKVQHTGILA